MKEKATLPGNVACVYGATTYAPGYVERGTPTYRTTSHSQKEKATNISVDSLYLCQKTTNRPGCPTLLAYFARGWGL